MGTWLGGERPLALGLMRPWLEEMGSGPVRAERVPWVLYFGSRMPLGGGAAVNILLYGPLDLTMIIFILIMCSYIQTKANSSCQGF